MIGSKGYEELLKLVMELYENHEVRFQPLYPWVFLRVLPKETKTQSGLWIPDSAKAGERTNKPNYEGIVLATWKPFHRHFKTETIVPGDSFHTSALMESGLKSGDHVLFPHWAGLPVKGFDEKEYRMVSEDYKQAKAIGCITDKLNYDTPLIVDVAKVVNSHLRRYHKSKKRTKKSDLIRCIVDDLKSEFNIIPKDVAPRTRIGG